MTATSTLRIAAFLLIATCSSSAKPPERALESAGSGAVAVPTPGSAADPWVGKDPDPATELTLLRADVDVICGAAKVTGGKVWMDVGPYIAETMKTAYKVELFANVRTTTLDEVIERIRSLMAKAKVDRCDTLDVLIANDPRKHG